MEDDQWLGLKVFDLRREPQCHSEKLNQEAKGPMCVLGFSKPSPTCGSQG